MTKPTGLDHRRDLGRPIPRPVRERQRRAAEVVPKDLRQLRYAGAIAPGIKPFVAIMAQELGDLLADKGDGVTAAERAVLEDAARLGLLLRATFASYLQGPDPSLARTCSLLAGRRAANLAAVGMERRARELDALSYIESKSVPEGSA